MQLGSHLAVAVVGADSTPSLGTSIWCRCGPKKTKKKKNESINISIFRNRNKESRRQRLCFDCYSSRTWPAAWHRVVFNKVLFGWVDGWMSGWFGGWRAGWCVDAWVSGWVDG